MILFPIAVIWVIVIFAWILKNSLNEPDAPPKDGPRRFRRPRGPRPGPERPSDSRSPSRTASTASRPHD
jgi:hypothetical protein